MVEAALVTPVFLVMLFGVIEGGLLMRDWSTVGDATEAGVRSGSTAGSEVDADWQILRAIRTGSAVIDDASIKKIVVYHASTPGAGPHPSCMAGTASAIHRCNVYQASDWQRLPDEFGCVSETALDGFWCPTSRETEAGGTDLVGVWIQAEHKSITKMFGESVTIEDHSVLALEANRSQ
jgi:hypothetical protein